MKYIKYITLLLVIGIFAACSDKEVTYPMEPVDESQKTFVQINYNVPLTNVVANRIYKIQLNDQVYENRGAALMNPYGQYPGTSHFFMVDAGEIHVKLIDNKDNVIYESSVQLNAGRYNNLFIFDFNKEPIVIDRTTIPTFAGADSTITKCNLKFYNFLYETNGVPSTDKIQVVLKNTATGEYDQPIGQPIGFGECSDWMNIELKWDRTKIISGEERKDLVLAVYDGQTGEYKGTMQYTKSNGSEAQFTDYWTMGAGRSSKWVLHGVRTNKTFPVAISSFYYE